MILLVWIFILVGEWLSYQPIFMFPMSQGAFITLELIYLLLWDIIMSNHHMLLQSFKIAQVGFGNLLTDGTVSVYFMSNIPTKIHL